MILRCVHGVQALSIEASRLFFDLKQGPAVFTGDRIKLLDLVLILLLVAADHL